MNVLLKKLNYLYQQELKRQKRTLNLIASENYPSKKVLNYSGSLLTTKYSEGYPSRRYYQGCKYVDEIENLAINLVKKIFGAEYANVQPHSGSQANQAVYLALLKPGDKILSLNLLSGGHLTHGAKVNFSGFIYLAHYYNVNPLTQKLDYGEIRKMAKEVKPKLIVAGYSSYSLKIDFAQFRVIADEVGAYLLADIAHVAGLAAVGLFPNPVPYADVVNFTTHKTLRGPRGAVILARKELGQKIDRAVFPGNQGGPAQNIIAAKTQCFIEALQPNFKKYQEKVLENAKIMSAYFLQKGAKVISGGTETHLLTIDTKVSYNLTGKEAAEYSQIVKITSEQWTNGSPQALQVNGFTWKEIMEKGKEVEVVREEIKKIFKANNLNRDNSLFICQIPCFDRPFFNQIITSSEQQKLKWPYHWLDLASMYWAKKFGKTNGLSKDKIAQAYFLPAEEKPHRASNGVKHLVQCYKAVLKKERKTSNFSHYRPFLYFLGGLLILAVIIIIICLKNMGIFN